jgi:hypothetical protein
MLWLWQQHFHDVVVAFPPDIEKQDRQCKNKRQPQQHHREPGGEAAASAQSQPSQSSFPCHAITSRKIDKKLLDTTHA